jgi:flagellar protein FlgJ
MMAGMSGISPMNTSSIDTSYIPFSEKRTDGSEPRASRSAENPRDFAPLLEKARKLNASESEKKLSKEPGFDGKLYEQCEALETFLIKNMLSQMRKTVMKADLVDTGYAGEVYEDMLWEEYAKEYTKKAQFGFAELAYLELSGQRGKKLPQ